MTHFLDKWAEESIENQKICFRESLIVDVTEDLLIAMEDKSITASDLSKRLSQSKSSISELLNGSKDMTLSSLADICFTLDIKPVISLKDISNESFKKI